MAINYVGVVFTGSASEEASEIGYTPPVVTPISDTDIVLSTNVDIGKSVVEDADPALTWQAIYTELDVSGVAFSSFFDATNTVDSYLECSSIELIDNPKYGDNPPFYRCNVKQRTKVTV